MKYINNKLYENLVTAAAWLGHLEWIRKFLELLGSKIKA